MSDLPVFAWAHNARPEIVHHEVKSLWLKVSAKQVENYTEPLVLLDDVRSALRERWQKDAETAAWMICEPGCKYGPTFGTENAAWSALTKAPPGSELVELVRRTTGAGEVT
jgi:hypothetical protein